VPYTTETVKKALATRALTCERVRQVVFCYVGASARTCISDGDPNEVPSQAKEAPLVAGRAGGVDCAQNVENGRDSGPSPDDGHEDRPSAGGEGRAGHWPSTGSPSCNGGEGLVEEEDLEVNTWRPSHMYM